MRTRQAHAMGWLGGFFALLFVSPWWAVIILGLLAPLLIACFIAAIPIAVIYAAIKK